MKRVKQIVQYWCDDVIKGKYLGKGVVAAVLDTGDVYKRQIRYSLLMIRVQEM